MSFWHVATDEETHLGAAGHALTKEDPSKASGPTGHGGAGAQRATPPVHWSYLDRRLG